MTRGRSTHPEPWTAQPPVVIAGVGGSGTRIVAQLLMELGFLLGHDLNHANDNLTFTLLLRRGQAFLRSLDEPGSEVDHALNVLCRSQFGLPLGADGMKVILAATGSQIRLENSPFRFPPRLWPLRSAAKALLAKKPSKEQVRGWGWKEPNSHIFLAAIDRVFPGFRYIHTMRNGLDMAFSRNQQQLKRWGTLFGVDVPSSTAEIPMAALRYWVAANRRALEFGQQRLGPDRFLLLNFDTLCLNPREQVKKLLAFLRVGDVEDVSALSALPQVPRSMGRYREHGLEGFDPADIQAVRNFGYEINDRN